MPLMTTNINQVRGAHCCSVPLGMTAPHVANACKGDFTCLSPARHAFSLVAAPQWRPADCKMAYLLMRT